MANTCCNRETYEDSDYIERCAERQDKKRKRMDPKVSDKVTIDLCSLMDQMGDSIKAKMSGREKSVNSLESSYIKNANINNPFVFKRTCSICGYVNGNITPNGERMYQVEHSVDKVPFDACYFCWNEISFDDSFTVTKCHNDCIPSPVNLFN